MADVDAVEEDVDEGVDPAFLIDEPRPELRVRRDQPVDDLADRGPAHVDALRPSGRRSERWWNPDLAHARPSSQSSNAANDGGIAGARPASPARALVDVSEPSSRASGVFRPFPVTSATTSSPSRMTPRRRAASAAATVTPPAVSA